MRDVISCLTEWNSAFVKAGLCSEHLSGQPKGPAGRRPWRRVAGGSLWQREPQLQRREPPSPGGVLRPFFRAPSRQEAGEMGTSKPILDMKTAWTSTRVCSQANKLFCEFWYQCIYQGVQGQGHPLPVSHAQVCSRICFPFQRGDSLPSLCSTSSPRIAARASLLECVSPLPCVFRRSPPGLTGTLTSSQTLLTAWPSLPHHLKWTGSFQPCRRQVKCRPQEGLLWPPQRK